MSECLTLPNVDIFDPVHTAKHWARCATQQEINAYLNKQISINRRVLVETIETQNKINANLKINDDDHETRIKSLEDRVDVLDTLQSEIQVKFNNLDASNTQFKSEVESLVNLYQTTISTLSDNVSACRLSLEAVKNEVNTLKSSLDMSKIQELIQGYDALLEDLKQEIEAAKTALREEFQGNFDDFENRIEAIESDNENFQSQVNQDLISNRNYMETNIANIFEAIAKWRENLTTAIQALESKIKLGDDSLQEQIDELDKKVDTNAEASRKRDEELNTLIYEQVGEESEARAAAIAAVTRALNEETEARAAGDSSLTDQLQTLNERVTQEVNTVNATIQEQVNRLEGSIAAESTNRTDGDNALDERLKNLEESDGKQWTTINNTTTLVEEALTTVKQVSENTDGLGAIVASGNASFSVDENFAPAYWLYSSGPVADPSTLIPAWMSFGSSISQGLGTSDTPCTLMGKFKFNASATTALRYDYDSDKYSFTTDGGNLGEEGSYSQEGEPPESFYAYNESGYYYKVELDGDATHYLMTSGGVNSGYNWYYVDDYSVYGDALIQKNTDRKYCQTRLSQQIDGYSIYPVQTQFAVRYYEGSYYLFYQAVRLTSTANGLDVTVTGDS